MLSLGVAGYGLLKLIRDDQSARSADVPLVVTGLGGALVAYAIDRSYRAKVAAIAS